MPTSVRPTGTFTVEFFDSVDGQYRLVDRIQADDLLRATAGEISSIQVLPEKGITYTADTFDFVFVTSHSVLKGGSIVISIPSEMKLMPDAACSGFEAPLAASARCIFFPDQSKLQVLDGFKDGPQTDIKLPLKFKVNGIYTLRSSRPISDFSFSTLDSSGFSIDAFSSFVLSPMQASRPLTEVLVTSDQAEVGKLGNVTFTFASPVPLQNGDVLILSGPAQGRSQDIAFTYNSCNGGKGLDQNLTCVLKGTNSLEATLSISDGDTLSAQTKFSLKVSQIQNPQSLKPSPPFSARIVDGQGYLIAQVDRAG